jgi:hypothetical protein
MSINSSPASADSLELLKDRDYTIVLARTAQAYPATPPVSRWQDAYQSVLLLVQQCEALDPDGITLYVSCQGNDAHCIFRKYEHVTSQNLIAVVETHYPPNVVALDVVIPEALDDYLKRKAAGVTKANGEILLVMLDGEPSDLLEIARSIVHTTHQLDRDEELGIGFVQIGQDPIATGFLKALDQNLKENGAKFDIVHTKVLDSISPDCLLDFLQNVLDD